MYSMRVLLVGGTKFIGPYVASILVADGHEVIVFHRGETESRIPSGVRHIHSPNAAIPVLEFPLEVVELKPDVVIHMIAMGEDDTCRALEAFKNKTSRIVWISSGDVYRAYGLFAGLEKGDPEPGLLNEDSPLREVLYPYRKSSTSAQDLNYFYEKILLERAVLENSNAPSVILRLPKVYGPGGNADLATIYRYRHHPTWRWTHGYVENVAQAVVLAALHPAALGRTYNVGEAYTPTVAERLKLLPPSDLLPDYETNFDFRHDIAYDTSRIRRELAFRELVTYEEGLTRTFATGTGACSSA